MPTHLLLRELRATARKLLAIRRDCGSRSTGAGLRFTLTVMGLLLAAGCSRPPAAQLSVSYLSKNAAGQIESSGVSSMTTVGPPDQLSLGIAGKQLEIKVVEVKSDRAVIEVTGLNLGEERVEVPFGSAVEVFPGSQDVGVRIAARGK